MGFWTGDVITKRLSGTAFLLSALSDLAVHMPFSDSNMNG
jgi:hypothetical protein